MTSLAQISVFDSNSKTTTVVEKVALPSVFTAPIRNDIIQHVHMNIAKNRRQAHGVDPKAGMKHSAESWGTGRAVARIPRISGSGTHRSGQAAFGNMCRKGRMFAPLHTWRRWHRRVNIKQKRHAVSSAIAASGIVPLVMARGHRVQNVPQLPLVIDNKMENIEKTKEAVGFLKRFGAYDDVKKVADSKSLRAGKGKMRNRRYQMRKGPLVIYKNDCKLVKAVRNIPGIDICNVNRLNLLQLAPGGHMGRFCIWTKDAFQTLDSIFGSYAKRSSSTDYQLQRQVMTNADLARIINSNEVQSAINNAKTQTVMHIKQKKNPLNNNTALFRLNPNAKLTKETARKANELGSKNRQAALKLAREHQHGGKGICLSEKIAKEIKKVSAADHKKNQKSKQERKKQSQKWIKNFDNTIDEATKKAKQQEADWIKEGLVDEADDE